ncbi:NACHT and WD repeat domain-containing protein [Nocardia sp. NPDC020380]|uniref:NACHT and WD repeat domain-containing protein n=1 Tax=Nocardia sp. NPDC020380 TaxID=3364309 RepID=UPI003787F901
MVPGARERFAEWLTALFELAGAPVIKSVVRRANSQGVPGAPTVTGQRFSDWRRGNTLPASFEAVLPVLTVLIEDAKARPQSADGDRQLLDLERWLALWQQAKNGPSAAALRVREPGHPPYRGLSPYRAEDADLFFGRDSTRAAIDAAITAVEADRDRPRLVLVVGVSGAGKSSLLAAGLQAHAQVRTPVLISPGTRPDAALRAAIEQAGDADDLLLLIDQGEELFTLGENGTARRVFLDELRKITAPEADRRITVVMALRSDFFNDVIEEPLLAAAMKDSSVIVSAMTEPELREAIIGPAQACGLKVEPALIDVVLRDLDTATSDDGRAALLPLLSHVLDATWSRRRGRTLTLEAYRAAGEMAGSVAATAERAWGELTSEQRHFARSILMTLTVIGPRSVTRNRVPHSALIGESTDPRLAEQVVNRLVDARLVVVDGDEIELLHEAVPRVWPRMAEWVSEEKEFGPARHRIEEDARNWSGEGRPATLLYDAKRLETVDVVTGTGGSINRIAQEFVAESIRHQRGQSSRRRILWSAAAMLGVVALLAAALAVVQYRAIQHERTDAEVAALIHESQRIQNFDPAESARMALAAYRTRPDNLEARARLLSTQAYPGISTSLERHAGRVNGLAYDKAGRLLASAGDDGVVRLWTLAGGDRPTALGDGLRGNKRGVTAVAFAPGGGVLAAAGYDKTLRFWDVRDPKQPRALGVLELGAPVLTMTYAPDGRSIVVGCESGQLTLVDVTDPAASRIRAQVPAHADAINALATSVDGTLLASSSDDHTVRLWSLGDDLRPLGQPVIATDAVKSLALGPDDRLAVGTANGSVQMWSLADRAAPREFGLPRTLHGAAVNALMFVSNDLMASAGDDGKVCLWQQTSSGFQPFGRPVGGNRGAISSLLPVDDGRLVTAGEDGRVRVWTRPPANVAVVSPAPFTSVELDRSGSRLVTGGADGLFQVWAVGPDDVSMTAEARTEVQPYHGVRVQIRPDGKALTTTDSEGGGVQLWNLADPARPVPFGAPLPTRTRNFTSAAFTPDGRVLVTGDDDFSIRLWDVGDPAAARPLGTASAETTRSFRSLAVSPDGKLAATGSGDATIYLWNISDRSKPVLQARLTGHRGAVSSLVFAADGRHLFSAANDETIRTWDLGTATAAGPPRETVVHTPSVTDMALDRSGRRLVSAGVDQSIRLWDVGNSVQPEPLGPSISIDLGARWFVQFDGTDENRVLGISDLASERWTTDPAAVAAQLCRSTQDEPDSGNPADATEFGALTGLCPD